jgi:hypothetical protein
VIIELLGVLALGISWDAWTRYLKHKEKVIGLKASNADIVIRNLLELKTAQQEAVEALEASVEKNRAILKGFIDSMTDLVKISEEDKQNLQNRLVSAKLGKKI